MSTAKLNTRIQQILSEIILYDMNDPRIKFASVLKVELSKDFRNCKVYISIYGTETEQRTVMRGLEHARGYIQRKMGDRLTMRYIPIINFVQDKSIEKSFEIAKQLDQIEQEKKSVETLEEPIE